MKRGMHSSGQRQVARIRRAMGEAGDRHIRRAGQVFGVLSVIVVPVYTVSFATNQSLLTSNISIVGNAPGMYRSFIFWGILCSVFFLSFVSYLFTLARYENRHARRVLYGVCGLLTLTVFIPFLPEDRPVAATLHNLFAMGAAVLTFLVTLMLVLHLKRVDPAIHRRALLLWSASAATCILLLLATGISGLLEVVFIISMCVLLERIMVWMHQSERIDAALTLQRARRRRVA